MTRYAVGLCAVLAVTSAALLPSSDGRSPHWPAVRAKHLEGHPCCEVCGGKSELEVHHVVPFHREGGHALELAPDNLITLCRHDHFLVGHAQSWKASNRTVREDAVTIRKILERIKRERDDD